MGTHTCIYGIEIHPCESDACTLNKLADMLRILWQVFEDPGGGGTDSIEMPDATACSMADLICVIREEVWVYGFHNDVEYLDMLHLMDFTTALLRHQYRSDDNVNQVRIHDSCRMRHVRHAEGR